MHFWKWLHTIMALAGLSLPCFAAGKLTPVPENLVFTLAPGETRFVLISAVPVQITDVKVLSLVDTTTGHLLMKDLNKNAITISDDYKNLPANKNLTLTATIDSSQFTIDGRHPDSNPSYSGTLVVFFKTTGDKPTEDSDTIRFTVVRVGYSVADKPETAVLNLIETTAKAVLAKGSPFKICFASDKLSYELGKVDVPQPFDANGFPVPLDAIHLDNPPTAVSTASRACIRGMWNAEVPVQSFKVTATFVVPYRALAPGAGWKQLASTIDFVRPAIAVRIGDNNEVKFWIERTNPFAECTEYTNPNISSIYSTTPAGLLLRKDLPLRSELTINDAEHLRPTGSALISLVVDGGKIQFKPSIPRGRTNLRGNVYVEPPDVGDEVVLHPVFLVKDSWFLRLGSAAGAYFAAWLLYMATTRFRSRILHDGTRRNLSARLSQFLSVRPDLASTDSVVLTRQLLADSISLDRAGETALADQSLQSASSRIDGLISSPPPAASPLIGGLIAIRVLQPTNKQIVGGLLTLIVADPTALQLPAIVTWTITNSNGGETLTQSGEGRLSIQFRFPAADTYTIKVTAPHLTGPLTRSLPITAGPVHNWFTELAAIDWLTQVAALVLACLAAYFATSSSETWGTSSDYASLLTSAFGVSAGIQGIRTVIGAVQGSI